VTVKKKKLLLITPPYHCGVVEVAGRWLPLNLLYVASAARRAGVEPVLFDAMSRFEGLDAIRAAIVRERPEFIATYSITATVPAALDVARVARESAPDATVIVGGVHPSFMAEEFLRASDGNVDFVVRGEGEVTTEQLLRALTTGGDPRSIAGLAWIDRATGSFVQTAPRLLLEDLEGYPPAYDIADWSIYRYFVIPGSRLGAVSTARGCSHSCSFCSQQKFWEKRSRGRRPESVVDEIEMLYRKYGVNVILISDEYPTFDAARWEEILDRLIALDLPVYLLMETRAPDIVRDERILPKYRKAGVVHIYVGLESTEQETLDLIGKELSVDVSRASLDLIRAHGMLSETSFVLGFPNETEESVRRTLELSKTYNPDMAHYLCITPWPYADLWDEMKDRVRTRDYSKYNLIEPIVEPYAMTLQELDLAIIRCYRDFYMGKMLDIKAFPDEFRRNYMMSSMKLIMKSSFLMDKMKKLAFPMRMPAAMAG
jgi:anaerobic magnesium-protoporphyrin IX monomethyl ester cyclase